MWKRKTDEQLATERRRARRSMLNPVLLFLLCSILSIVKSLEGPRTPTNRWPVTWSIVLLTAAFMGVAAAVADIIAQAAFGRTIFRLTDSGPTPLFGRRVRIVMCDSCHCVKHRDGESRCACGGSFDDFEHWTWESQPRD